MSKIGRLTTLLVLFVVLALAVMQLTLSSHLHTFFGQYVHQKPDAILFTGDVMLARTVETRINTVGKDNFFAGLRSLHERARYVVGNFEGSIPNVHSQTKDFDFKFSVNNSFMSLLRNAHFTHFTLANNHAMDFGVEGLTHTREVLQASSLVPFGDPLNVGTSSIAILDINGLKVGVIGLHAVWNEPDHDAVARMLDVLKSKTDAQIAVVHWGTEYEKVHTLAQENFARFLISHGVDAIIGHHPHVVEDIGLVDGRPVFYSLGNYIFDQYWSDDVENGLAVLTTVHDRVMNFDLVPVHTDHSVPRLLDQKQTDAFLRTLALRSDEALKSEIAAGSISVSF